MACPVDGMGDLVEDTVGSEEKTADLERVIIIVIAIIIMIRMTWEVWWILQRTVSWPNYWSEGVKSWGVGGFNQM